MKPATQRVYHLGVFLLLSLAYLLVVFQRMSPAVMASDLTGTFHVGPVELGIIGSMYYYPYAAMQIPCGVLADTIGPRRLVATSLLLAGLGSFIFGTAGSYPVVLLGRFLIGLGVSCVYVPTLKILAVWFKRNEFATYTGILGAIGACGALFAAAPLAFVIGRFGWRAAIILIGGITLFLAAAVFLLVREISGTGKEASASIPAAKAPTPRTNLANVLGDLKQVCTNRQLWPLMIRGFAFAGAGLGLQSLWAGPYLTQILGMSRTQAGELLMLLPLGRIMVAPVGGYLSDRVFRSRRRVNIAAALLSLSGWLPLAFLTGTLTTGSIGVLFFALGAAEGLGIGSVAIAQVKELFPPRLAGTATGVNNFFQSFGAALFPVFFGVIIGRYSAQPGVYAVSAFHAAYLFAALCILLGTFALFFSRENQVTDGSNSQPMPPTSSFPADIAK